MNIKQIILDRVEYTEIGKKLINEQRSRLILFAVFSFLLNFLYAVYNGALGIINQSIWFVTLCAYYVILSTMRLSAVLCERQHRNTSSKKIAYFVMKLCGALFVLLSFVLAGVIYISQSRNIATKHDEIVMITIATYVFYKITLTIIKAIKQRKDASPLLHVIRCIGYAEVLASVLTLQRSMLISFGEMNNADIRTMNLLTGSAVCLLILTLGVALIIKTVAESKNNAPSTL